MDRAIRIASIAAEELICSEGAPTGRSEEWTIPPGCADEYLLECVAHLCWTGEAVSRETDDGHIIVAFGSAQ
jgi:hypothetical protein